MGADVGQISGPTHSRAANVENPPHRNQAGFATRAVHVGQEPDPLTGAFLPPVYHATTFVQDEIGRSKGFDYSLSGNPTRNNLDLCLADLGGAENASVFQSGLPAAATLLERVRFTRGHIRTI